MKKPNILMVDDHEPNLLTLEMVLDNLDVCLHRASSGNDALALMLNIDFALVLLDVQMPDMDGFEVAEIMRQSEKTRLVPIIFVTANNTDDMHVSKGYKLSAVDYLFKPIVPEILKGKVAVFADLYKQRALIQEQMDEIRALREILPICMHCQKIRNEAGDWDGLVAYMQAHTDVKFSHGICSECKTIHYPEFSS